MAAKRAAIKIRVFERVDSMEMAGVIGGHILKQPVSTEIPSIPKGSGQPT